MKKLSLAAALLAITLAEPALARDDKHLLSVRELLEYGQAQGKLDGSVRFYFAGQKTPSGQRLSSGVANRKTNAFNKTDEEACRWSALSALVALQEKAKALGANAVVNIESYYKRNTFKSATEYECHAGAMVAGVALKGTYAKVK